MGGVLGGTPWVGCLNGRFGLTDIGENCGNISISETSMFTAWSNKISVK